MKVRFISSLMCIFVLYWNFTAFGAGSDIIMQTEIIGMEDFSVIDTNIEATTDSISV